MKSSINRVVKSRTMRRNLSAQLKKEVNIKTTPTGLVRSTGVLKKNPNTNFAHTEVMNRGASPITANVMVFDWDTNTPVRIGNNTVTVPANALRFFNTSLVGVNDHYEVIVTLSSTTNVIVNHFGLSGNTPQEGNVVLDRDFVTITL
ncbi:hypothetical protein KP806_15775 [Paenibacillus sp. N4]|uniref:hypothetical protein n=1 Tax=Paenibacillus vietnamensis TaxID=2590547 RepID=UPI001CD0F922|nr:hypothetical protein [Paenibacillus vietnamensis]MCA0756514.1 hypothetical protein [Paenibacillus vietnamensis]